MLSDLRDGFLPRQAGLVVLTSRMLTSLSRLGRETAWESCKLTHCCGSEPWKLTYAKRLAVTELRLIVSKLVWNFDIELAEEVPDFLETAQFFVSKPRPCSITWCDRC